MNIRRRIMYRSDGLDRELTWFGHEWYYGPSRWVARSWNALPVILLALILWRVWS